MWNSFICVITLLFVTDVAVCVPDYIYEPEVEGWLSLHPVADTWYGAFSRCHLEGAVLASPTTPQLARALERIMRTSELDTSIFLGVRAFSKGDFMSIEGVPLTDLTIKWGRYDVEKEPEDVLSLSRGGYTHTTSPSHYLPFICYKKRDNTTVLNECGTFDDDYQFYPTTGSCYKFHKKPRSWWMAHKTCIAEGGHLVILNDMTEVDIIMSISEIHMMSIGISGGVYIGLQNWGSDHIWLTLHGEELKDVYHTWAQGEPDRNGFNKCVNLWAQKELRTIHCDHELWFFCEKDPNTSRFGPVNTVE